MSAKNINLAFATDENYFIPFFVSVLSIFINSKKGTKYNVHLLFSGELSDENFSLLSYLRDTYDDHRIFLHKVGDEFNNVKLTIKHISSATFYRLKLPSLLNECDKVLYLDVDIVVCKDLTELFEIDLKDNYCAGVRAAAYLSSSKSINKTIELLKIDKVDKYINAGVVLFNLKKIREDNIGCLFAELLKNNYPSQDQDIINKACYPNIITIPFRYNVMTKYHPSYYNSYVDIDGVSKAYSEEEWGVARRDPVIIHYADRKKPWIDLNTDYAFSWWFILSKTPFFLSVYKKYKPKFHFSHGLKNTNILNFLTVKTKVIYLYINSILESYFK